MTASDLLTVASIIAGFGTSAFVFRIQRELEMSARGERTWFPVADALLLAATLGAYLALIVLLSEYRSVEVARSTLIAASVLALGYFPAVLAHYRLVIGTTRTGLRANPEPAEKWITWVTIIAAAVLSRIL
jgi:hypothetical protein